ncbi:MAG: hypothetical protein ACRDKA_01800 [Actinomycetota bacterium]
MVAILAGAVAVGYLGLIASEGGGNDLGRVALVASTIVGAAGAAWVGSVVAGDRVRAAALGVAAGILLSLGYLGLFSIGLFLIVAGILAAVAATTEVTRSGDTATALLGFAVGLAVVLLPFFLSA